MSNIAPAGGRATESGMSFQAGVGAWFAAHVASAAAIGSRFGLSPDAIPQRIQFETGEGMDDISIAMSDGSRISVQCKVRPSLSVADGSALSSTLGQLVDLYSSAAATGDPDRTAGVLAVAADASRSLDDLEEACRMFDAGGDWVTVYAQLSDSRKKALDIFRAHTAKAWRAQTQDDLSDPQAVALARIFRIARFDVDEGGADWREAARTMGQRVFAEAQAGARPLSALLNTTRTLIRNGAPADRAGLLRELRRAGHEDKLSPQFDADIDALKSWTQTELHRLQRHQRLPIGQGLQINRDCMPELRDAAAGGSLLVVGEPGAGKTGVLVRLAEHVLQDGAPLVFLSVDDLSGVTDLEGLRTALGLQGPILDALAAWPGSAGGTLVMDALDASRGGSSEPVFVRLIEQILERLGTRWSVVASIRTFDLKNGRRFKVLMGGDPPSAAFVEPGLEHMRHFKIPQLSDAELDGLGRTSVDMASLFAAAPQGFCKLLRNVFNLSLAAELIANGTPADAIRGLTTQSELIERYEDERLDSTRLQNAVAAVVTAMATQERLTIKKVTVSSDALDEVIAKGVLASAPADRVAFAHHVLFDHAAGRFYLDLTTAHTLAAQIAAKPRIGFLLGPALRFALKGLWHEGEAGRADVWRLLIGLAALQNVDPVVSSVALRTAVESVSSTDDVSALCSLIRNDTEDVEATAHVLSRMARFVRVSVTESGAPSEIACVAWSAVALAAAQAGRIEFVDGARILLFTLFDQADFGNAVIAEAFGTAARALLSFALAEPRLAGNTASNAIRFVAKTFATDPIASRALLLPVITEPRFTLYATEEAPWLAEGVRTIVRSDPAFVEQIYAVLFGRAAPQDGDSWFGGQPSRILPLRTNRRQDYEHGRWHLQEALETVLVASPEVGTRAVSYCAIGVAREEYSDAPSVVSLGVSVAGRPISIIDDRLSLEDWSQDDGRDTRTEKRILSVFTEHLRSCTPDVFERSALAAADQNIAASVWARLFGVGAQRLGVADHLLWTVASAEATLDIYGLSRDAISYLAAALPRRPMDERVAFEERMLAGARSADEDTARVGMYRAARLLSLVEDDAVATPLLRELKSELAAEERLVGNRPHVSMSFRWGGDDVDIVDSLLTSQGVNVKEGPDLELRNAIRPIDALLKREAGDSQADLVARLWAASEAAVQTIDRLQTPAPMAGTLHASWGVISNALAKIAESDQYSPATTGHPPLEMLLQRLDRLAGSSYPESSASDDGDSMGWGNWDVRVYAASGYVALARRFWAPDMLPRLLRMLSDPVATVRLQVAQSLNTLWEVARPEMWQMVDLVVDRETNLGVLGFFLAGPMSRLTSADPTRCVELIAKVLARVPAREMGESRRRETMSQAVANSAGFLWLRLGNTTAKGWIDSWIANPAGYSDYLWALVSALREALFLRFAPNASAVDTTMQDRAREIIAGLVAMAGPLIREGASLLQAGDKERGEHLYKVGVQQVEHACNQLYFGSGASRVRDEGAESTLSTDAQKLAFLTEYGDVLTAIGEAGVSSTIYHLFELYEHLVVAAPANVFDRIALLLVGPAAADGYHFESLASDALVRMVRNFLADHRGVFEEPARRESLVRVLELFSTAGSPDALKLLYELPDLLR